MKTLFKNYLSLELRDKNIDEDLVGRRNKIAHGEKIEGRFSIQKYEEMHYLVTTVLRVISDVIFDSARNQKYLRNN